MLLREIMQKKVITVSPESTIREAAKKMKDYRIGYPPCNEWRVDKRMRDRQGSGALACDRQEPR